MKIYCKCGFFKFIFNDIKELNTFQSEYGLIVNNQFQWQEKLKDRYTLKDKDFHGNKAIVNYESNNFIDLLDNNLLAIDNINKIITNYNNINIKQILNGNKCMDGLFYTDRNIKSYNGFYDVKNRITIINDYENY